jgi:hypothetical protein
LEVLAALPWDDDTVEVNDTPDSPRLGDGLRVSPGPAEWDALLGGFVGFAGSARTCWGMMAWSVLADFAGWDVGRTQRWFVCLLYCVSRQGSVLSMVNDSSFLRVFVNSGSCPFTNSKFKTKGEFGANSEHHTPISAILYDEYQHQNNYNVNNPTRTLVLEKEASFDEVFMQKNQLILQEPANAPHLPSYWDYIY